jgi:hypothetical protein
MSRRVICVLWVVLSLASVANVHAITWGKPDGNGHPYVGTIIFAQSSGLYSCSGTLLSPTVMVTAGHCTAEGGQVNLATWVSFDPAITFEGWDNYPDIGSYLDAEWIPAQAIPHPLFDTSGFDVGVVILSQPVALSTYGALPPLGLLDLLTTGKARQDRQFTVVGYGLQGILYPFAQDDYARYAGTVSLIEVNSTFTGDGQSAKFTNNPGRGNGSGGSCFGDSGGPLFWGNSNVIGAIVSWGITPCIGVDYQFRLDTAIAQDFIKTYLP